MTRGPLWKKTKIKTEDIHYQWGGQSFSGFLAQPKKLRQKKIPGVIIVHEWWGHNNYIQRRAKQLAEEGFVVFALDMYGEGKQAQHPKKAGELSSQVMSSMDVMKKRFLAGLEILKNHQNVSQDNISAMGYCFGGGVVLQMAREKLALKKVVSFHGSLKTKWPVKGELKSPEILVFHGSKDPLVSPENLNAFKQELNAAKANYEIVEYSGVMHAFTNPDADKYAKKFNLPLAYDADADKKSWERTFFLNRSLHDSNHAFSQSLQRFFPVIILFSIIPVTEERGFVPHDRCKKFGRIIIVTTGS